MKPQGFKQAFWTNTVPYKFLVFIGLCFPVLKNTLVWAYVYLALQAPNLCSHLCVCMHVCAQSCLTLCSFMDCSPPVLLSMEFTRQEYWSALPFSPPGDLPDPGVKPVSRALASVFFTMCHLGSPSHSHTALNKHHSW